MTFKNPAEDNKLWEGRAAEVARRTREELKKPLPAWMAKIAEKDPEVRKIRDAANLIVSLVELGRIEAGLSDKFSVTRRKSPGRPVRAPHPLPRRDCNFQDPNNLYKEHKEKHVFYYQEGCLKCYMREYNYFKKHPDSRPKGMRTAGADDQGRVQAARMYQPGWDPEKYPFNPSGALGPNKARG